MLIELNFSIQGSNPRPKPEDFGKIAFASAILRFPTRFFESATASGVFSVKSVVKFDQFLVKPDQICLNSHQNFGFFGEKSSKNDRKFSCPILTKLETCDKNVVFARS